MSIINAKKVNVNQNFVNFLFFYKTDHLIVKRIHNIQDEIPKD